MITPKSKESTMSNRQVHAEPLLLRRYHPLQDQPRSLWAILRATWIRRRSRQRVARLDQRMLKDIGISFAEAEAEANKPFWRD
jgi:uncharacterized protein YjiS (DUF1127 family)